MSTRTMIRAKLIVGGNQAERLKLAHQLIKQQLGTLSHPDLLIIENVPSVTINQIREIKKRLALKPYSGPMKIVLITEAEKTTLPAQNALLKTLEEPPGESLVILLAASKESLLPTIASRCQVIKLPEKPEMEINRSIINYQLSIINSILESGVGERVKIVEEIAPGREGAIKFCQTQLLIWREILLNHYQVSSIKSLPRRRAGQVSTKEMVRTLRYLQQTLTMLEANVNPRLALENLLFSYFPILTR